MAKAWAASRARLTCPGVARCVAVHAIGLSRQSAGFWARLRLQQVLVSALVVPLETTCGRQILSHTPATDHDSPDARLRPGPPALRRLSPHRRRAPRRPSRHRQTWLKKLSLPADQRKALLKSLTTETIAGPYATTHTRRGQARRQDDHAGGGDLRARRPWPMYDKRSCTRSSSRRRPRADREAAATARAAQRRACAHGHPRSSSAGSFEP